MSPLLADTQIDAAVIRILHLEDDAADRELIGLLLKEAGIACEITAIESQTSFRRNLEQGVWDLILSDFALPTFDGLQALEIAAKVAPSTPFIFVTGKMGEDVAVESLKSGATDYVLKQNISRLESSVRRALSERAERLRRLQAEEKLELKEAQLRFLAYHDSLTSLPNRAFLQDRLQNILLTCRRNDQKAALLFIDLDNFKNVNDSLGHSVGDLLLQRVGERLLKTARSNDIVARLGGDEFVVVLCGMKENTDAALAANRIRDAIAIDFVEKEHRIATSCSIGISVFPDDGSDSETLLKKADIALFSAKADGRNSWLFITPEMNARAQERISLEGSLRQALVNDEFFLEYQPQQEITSGKIVAAEALLRWRHPEFGILAPDVFIPIAESRGDIIPIGEWVLKTACAQARSWHDDGIRDLRIAVNVSPIQFRQANFLSLVRQALAEAGLAPEYLELELKESFFLSCDLKMIALLQELRKLGVRVAIDRFGAGYCSFDFLRRFRFSKLKIDGSFVRAVSENPQDTGILSAMISMGKILHMEVIAECVETSEQTNLLQSIGCDEIQGYVCSAPLSAPAFTELTRSLPSQSPSFDQTTSLPDPYCTPRGAM